MIAELSTHVQTASPSTKKYDSATLEYLVALRKIFERGLLSHNEVADGDAAPLQNICEGFQYFEEWCDEVREHGECCRC